MIKGKKNKFKEAVITTPDVKNAYKNGLQAFLRDHRSKIELGDSKVCEGSIDIDKATTQKYPQSNRWDYCFGYKGQVLFIEVHSANTSEVSVVIAKLNWLKEWLRNSAPNIHKLIKKDQNSFYWIQSNSCHILKNSKQHRQAVQMGIMPIARLKIG